MPDRRQFIRGRWSSRAAMMPSPEGVLEIASILVQTRPERLDSVAAAIGRIRAAEIFHRDERGKLVVVIEADGTDSIGDVLTRMSLLPHVISATLVYHATEPAEPGPSQDVPA